MLRRRRRLHAGGTHCTHGTQIRARYVCNVAADAALVFVVTIHTSALLYKAIQHSPTHIITHRTIPRHCAGPIGVAIGWAMHRVVKVTRTVLKTQK